MWQVEKFFAEKVNREDVPKSCDVMIYFKDMVVFCHYVVVIQFLNPSIKKFVDNLATTRRDKNNNRLNEILPMDFSSQFEATDVCPVLEYFYTGELDFKKYENVLKKLVDLE